MALSKEQFLELRKQGLSVDQIVKFERGVRPDGQPVDFSQEEEKGWGGKIRDFAASFLGGDYLAKGAGMAAASGGVQKDLSGGQQGLYDQQDKTIAAMKKAREAGEDTSKLETQMRNLQGSIRQQSGTQKSFENAMPTDKQVYGSTARLMATMALPAIGRGFSTARTGTFEASKFGQRLIPGGAANLAPRAGGLSQLTGLNNARGFWDGAGRGAMAGGIEGALGGGVIGGGIAAEQNQDARGIATGAAIGTVAGAALGVPLGALGGGIQGRMQYNRSPQSLTDKVTPKVTDLTPEEYKEAMQNKMITPATKSRPAQYKIPKEEMATVRNHPTLFEKDPVKSSFNVLTRVDEYDKEVGAFLKKNRFKVGLGPLEQNIKEAFAEIDDINIDEKRLAKLKNDLIARFFGSMKDNYTDTLWQHRKNYDREIEAAFSGAPNVQKEVKIALRNAVQDFLGTVTPGDFYANRMKTMSSLLRVEKLLEQKAVKERGLSSVQKFFHDNPGAKKALPWLLGGIAAYGTGGWWAHSRSDTG